MGKNTKLDEDAKQEILIQARRTDQQISSVQIGTLFTNGDFREVIDTVSPEYLASSSQEESAQRQLMNYVAGSAYNIAVEAANTFKEELAKANASSDANQAYRTFFAAHFSQLFKDWPRFQHAKHMLTNIEQRFPALELDLQPRRQQMAQLFNLIKIQAKFAVSNTGRFSGVDGD